MSDEIIVVGGGISGLTFALCMHARGKKVTVYESVDEPVDEISNVGYGLNILPYAGAVLKELNIYDELIIDAVVPKYIRYFDSEIDQIHTIKKENNNVEQFSILRWVLQNKLLEKVRSLLGENAVLFGLKYIKSTQTSNNEITVVFKNNQGKEVIKNCSLLVGADGVNSMVYNKNLPYQELNNSGVKMWRGVSRCGVIYDGQSVLKIGTTKEVKFVIYPVKNIESNPRHQVVNWVIEVNKKSSFYTKNPTEIFNHFSEKKQGEIIFKELASNITSSLLETEMKDRDPIKQWFSGRVVLIGDAAHPIYPVGSNGAGQSILDADCLSRMLCEHDIRKALIEYNRLRLNKAYDYVLGDRYGYPDRLLDDYDFMNSSFGYNKAGNILSNEEKDNIIKVEYEGLYKKYKRNNNEIEINSIFTWSDKNLNTFELKYRRWIKKGGSLTEKLRKFGNFSVEVCFQGLREVKKHDNPFIVAGEKYLWERTVILMVDGKPCVSASSFRSGLN